MRDLNVPIAQDLNEHLSRQIGKAAASKKQIKYTKEEVPQVLNQTMSALCDTVLNNEERSEFELIEMKYEVPRQCLGHYLRLGWSQLIPVGTMGLF